MSQFPAYPKKYALDESWCQTYHQFGFDGGFTPISPANEGTNVLLVHSRQKAAAGHRMAMRVPVKVGLFAAQRYGRDVCVLYLMLASLAGCTTQGVLLHAESTTFATLDGKDTDSEIVALFVNYSECAFGNCESPRLEVQERTVACIQTGLRRVKPGFGAIAGDVELPQDTSALISDPRHHGQADSRFDANLAARMSQKGIRYAVVVDLIRATHEVRKGDFQPLGMREFGRRTSRQVESRIQAVLVRMETGRWLARVICAYRGDDSSVAGIAFPYIPIPFAWTTTTTASVDACEAAGEALGKLLQGRTAPDEKSEKPI